MTVAETDYDVIQLLKDVVADVRRYDRDQLSRSFTRADVKETIRLVLDKLMIGEPTDQDCQAVLDV